ncbi:20792_t:CDS:1, partial [Dentiscutata erythropus]
ITAKGSNKWQTVDSSSEDYSSYELEISNILYDNNNLHNLKVLCLAKESLIWVLRSRQTKQLYF